MWKHIEISWDEKVYFNNTSSTSSGHEVTAYAEVDSAGNLLGGGLTQRGLEHYGLASKASESSSSSSSKSSSSKKSSSKSSGGKGIIGGMFSDDDDIEETSEPQPGLSDEDMEELYNISFDGTPAEMLEQAGEHYRKVCKMSPNLEHEVEQVKEAKKQALEIIENMTVPAGGEELTDFMVVNEVLLDKSGLFHAMNNKGFKKLRSQYVEIISQPEFTRNAVCQKAADKLISKKLRSNPVVEKVMHERLQDAAETGTCKGLEFISTSMIDYLYAHDYLHKAKLPTEKEEIKKCIEFLLDKTSIFSPVKKAASGSPLDLLNAPKDLFNSTKAQVLSTTNSVKGAAKDFVTAPLNGGKGLDYSNAYNTLQNQYQDKLQAVLGQIDLLFPNDAELLELKKKCQSKIQKQRNLQFYSLFGAFSFLCVFVIIAGFGGKSLFLVILGAVLLIAIIALLFSGGWKKVNYLKKIGEGSVFDK